jgi:hypothetical protein
MFNSGDLDLEDIFLKNSSFNEAVLELGVIITVLDNEEKSEADLDLDLLLEDLDEDPDLLLEDLDEDTDLLLEDLDEDSEEEVSPPRKDSPFSSKEIENE